MSQWKAFAKSTLKLTVPLTAVVSATGLLTGAAGAAHSIKAGIYEEYPVEKHCLTTGFCVIFFDKVNKDLIVDKVSCSLKMKATNNPHIIRIVLGRGSVDKQDFVESFFLPAPQPLSTPAGLIASSMVADTQAVIPAGQRTAVLAEIVADVASVDVTLRCAISGHQP